MKLQCLAAAFCSALMVVPVAAHADTYRFLSKDDEDAATFINETSINRIGDEASVWLLTITGEYMRGGSPKMAYYLIQQELNCRTQRIRPAAMSTYSETGSNVNSDEKGDEWGPVEPGTIDQDIFKIVCQRAKTAGSRIKFTSPHTLAREFRNDILALSKKK